ncbi:MAG: two-component regulator propeller domain-containing protein, partial [Verrucomicrobiota bacterium]
MIDHFLKNLLSAPSRSFLWRWVGSICLAGWSCSAVGAQYLVNTYGADEGLPQNSVMSAAQTPDGYLWIGTLMGGVSRFDG